MQIKVFKEQYGADIQSVLLKDRQEQMAASIAAAELPATGLRTRAGAGTVIATQAGNLTQSMYGCYPS